MEKPIQEEALFELAELFKIFSDSTRIRILCELVDGELGVTEIADRLTMTQSAISHQLRLLKQSKLVRAQRDGKAVRYALADHHVLTILSQGMEHIGE